MHCIKLRKTFLVLTLSRKHTNTQRDMNINSNTIISKHILLCLIYSPGSTCGCQSPQLTGTLCLWHYCPWWLKETSSSDTPYHPATQRQTHHIILHHRDRHTISSCNTETDTPYHSAPQRQTHHIILQHRDTHTISSCNTHTMSSCNTETDTPYHPETQRQTQDIILKHIDRHTISC